MLSVSFDSVVAARERLRGQINPTPLTRSRVLSEMTQANVWLKFENFQFTASFKERGALNKLLSLDTAQRQAGVVAVSAGNHAQGVAYHATRLGIRSLIVMPGGTPFVKVRNTQKLGAEVILWGDSLAEAASHMEEEYVGRRGMTLVHPYDDPQVIAGQGTVALEMLESEPGLDMLVVPVGGGGLIGGVAVAAQASPGVRVVGVESARYPCAQAALSGDPSMVSGGQTIAEGIAVRTVGRLPLEILRALKPMLLSVDEAGIERAIALLASIEKVIVEGAGAAGLAALLSHGTAFAGRNVGIVLTGGNIDTRLLASVLMRQLVQESRLVALSIEVEDRPGFLSRVAGCIGESGGNIVQVGHDRLQGGIHAKSASLEVQLEAQDEGHVERIVRDLESAGFRALLLR
ncbi:threonine ammonia-lyase [Solimonas sp. K1W22B-7]|uniref:threonine ammonia-lyase n=1 Tax=Solimonas sp. K1W22B-7 TaxID=2303331 RepID=UPI000E334EF7|nr:threonine ammonia-lyase [Solimonas sp. K1W22B-7]AXQ30028.1 threonine ammonia-lyase [Solimonas sp. K1W22B-7]